MSLASRAVIDTNVLLSASRPGTVPSLALDRVLTTGTLLTSWGLLAEMDDVLRRPRMARFSPEAERLRILDTVLEHAALIDITSTITECRDPKDDMVLELAVDGAATVVITGDADLLALHPFRGVPILTPADFLAATAPPVV